MLLKYKNIMRSTFKILAALVCITACIEKPEPLEECELYDFGTVTVINESGIPLYVDVTWDNVNEETLLLYGENKVYNNIPAGNIKIWRRIPGEVGWAYETYRLYECQHLEFTWSPCG